MVKSLNSKSDTFGSAVVPATEKKPQAFYIKKRALQNWQAI